MAVETRTTVWRVQTIVGITSRQVVGNYCTALLNIKPLEIGISIIIFAS
jgi:hypothetical protein